MRTRTKGIQATREGCKIVNKEYKGRRIFARLGIVSQDAAEAWLRAEQAKIDKQLNQGTERDFAAAAERYLKECERNEVSSLEMIAYHITLVLPHIGTKPLTMIHSGTLEKFMEGRLAAGVKPATVNRTLEVVRTVLLRAARVWRNEDGTPWLSSPPLIEMLDTVSTQRPPYPLSWAEQAALFAQLPPHLERMALFAVNTGLRDENICGLRWGWEQKIPELGCSVFVIPPTAFKSRRPHVAILNDVAMSILEGQRNAHETYVFTFKGERVETMNNNGWQKARKRAGLKQVRVHDLRHTFGQRLRAAGVSDEDRRALMGHSTAGSMSDLYGTPTIHRLLEQANLVQKTRDSATLLRITTGAAKAEASDGAGGSRAKSRTERKTA